MDPLEIPFNQLLGLSRAKDPEQGLLALPDDERLRNHLGTVHAGAQFALAEACSGAYLLSRFPEYEGRIIPVVRKTQTKFKQPAQGAVSARAAIAPDIEEGVRARLEKRGRVTIPVQVEVFDADNTITMTATIEWFIQTME